MDKAVIDLATARPRRDRISCSKAKLTVDLLPMPLYRLDKLRGRRLLGRGFRKKNASGD